MFPGYKETMTEPHSFRSSTPDAEHGSIESEEKIDTINSKLTSRPRLQSKLIVSVEQPEMDKKRNFKTLIAEHSRNGYQ
jgi:hypothetical protein